MQNIMDDRTFLFSCVIKALIDNNVDDPDVALFYGVLKDDVDKVKEAIDKGGNPNVVDQDIIRKHMDILIKSPISERLALAVVGLLASPGKNV